MKMISNSMVNGLIRLIPVLIANIPLEKQKGRVPNAIRLCKVYVRKLKTLKDV